MPEIKQINTKKAPAAIGPYSQGVVAGPFVFVSGQLPIDPESGKMIQGDIRALTKQIISNIENILQAEGLGLDSVVRVDIFVKDLNDFATVNDEYSKHFKSLIKPARQTVQVPKLPLESPIEISCIAYKP